MATVPLTHNTSTIIKTMSHSTRRVFIKKSGAATLGSVLGLGLLPSLTRRLHATDQSGGLTNIKLSYTQTSLSQSWGYLGGTLTLKIQLSSSPGNGVCSGSAVMSVTRTATYTKSLPKVTWSASYSEISNIIWQCVGGVATATSVTHPTPPSSPDVAIANVDNPKETIGTLSTSGSPAASPAVSISATVLIGDELSPERTLGPLSYTPACC